MLFTGCGSSVGSSVIETSCTASIASRKSLKRGSSKNFLLVIFMRLSAVNGFMYNFFEHKFYNNSVNWIHC